MEDPDYDCQWNVSVTEAGQASTSTAPAAASSYVSALSSVHFSLLNYTIANNRSSGGSVQPTEDQIASLARLLTSVSSRPATAPPPTGELVPVPHCTR